MTAPGVSAIRLEARTNTPLRALRVHQRGAISRLWIKLERYNPTGSIKYRTAVGLLASLDAERPLVPGTRIVESTSGNLGLALARVLNRMGCHLVAVIDPKVTTWVRDMLVADGAELVCVQDRDAHGGYLLTRLATVRELCCGDPELRWSDQYANPANPGIHRDTTARELLEQTNNCLDALFVAVSTGGTLVGISEGVRAKLPDVRVYAVDAYGSLATSDVGRPHLLTGVGATRKSSFLTRDHYDRALRVADVDAFAYCRMLRSDTGLAVGGSSGAVLAAFGRTVHGRAEPFRYPVVVMPDGDDAYRATFYDDGWLAARGVLDRVRAAERLARSRGLGFELGGFDIDTSTTKDGAADAGR